MLKSRVGTAVSYSADMINVIKSKFEGPRTEGDFSWMLKQPHHEQTLFLFNDNEEEFYQHFQGGKHTCSSGGGNAAIRPYQCDDTPRALGIPTGSYSPGVHYKGYSALDNHVLKVLNDAFSQIDSLLASRRFTSLAFSWSDETKLGGKIFHTAQDVRNYIVDQIFAVASRH